MPMLLFILSLDLCLSKKWKQILFPAGIAKVEHYPSSSMLNLAIHVIVLENNFESTLLKISRDMRLNAKFHNLSQKWQYGHYNIPADTYRTKRLTAAEEKLQLRSLQSIRGRRAGALDLSLRKTEELV